MCGHRQLAGARPAEHLSTVYGDDYFSGGGAGYPDYLAEGPMLRTRGRRYGELLARHHNPGHLVDLGAAAGFVLAGLGDTGWTGSGIEPNETMATHGRRTLGLDISVGTSDTVVIEPQSLEAVTAIQVMAHVPDPRATVAWMHQCLRPGGVVLIETWDRASRTARVLGHRWHEYSPPSVLHWFTKDSLAGLCEAEGLVPIATGRLTKWLDTHHGASLLAHGGHQRLASVVGRLPARTRLPYPTDDHFWLIARRPR